MQLLPTSSYQNCVTEDLSVWSPTKGQLCVHAQSLMWYLLYLQELEYWAIVVAQPAKAAATKPMDLYQIPRTQGWKERQSFCKLSFDH